VKHYASESNFLALVLPANKFFPGDWHFLRVTLFLDFSFARIIKLSSRLDAQCKKIKPLASAFCAQQQVYFRFG
jgi:hypothetical protein